MYSGECSDPPKIEDNTLGMMSIDNWCQFSLFFKFSEMQQYLIFVVENDVQACAVLP
jgi:hypothetical protein